MRQQPAGERSLLGRLAEIVTPARQWPRRVEDVPDPRIVNPRDAIIRVTSTAICGSDLHLYGGLIPTMRSGDILGHDPNRPAPTRGPETAPRAPGTPDLA